MIKATAILSAHDLFLVTGTYMTENWEASTFVTNQSSYDGSISMNAINLEGYCGIYWQSCKPGSRGFKTGHTHIGQTSMNHDNLRSFEACCHCGQSPMKQCIFLRGWHIRKMIRFAESRLVVPISMENVRKSEWRRAQVVKKRDLIDPKTMSESLHAQGLDSSEQVTSAIEKAMMEDNPEEEDSVSRHGLLVITLRTVAGGCL